MAGLQEFLESNLGAGAPKIDVMFIFAMFPISLDKLNLFSPS